MHIVVPGPPRVLPVQNHSLIDEEEARARTLTRAIAVVVAAILVVLLCAVCGRVVL